MDLSYQNGELLMVKKPKAEAPPYKPKKIEMIQNKNIERLSKLVNSRHY